MYDLPPKTSGFSTSSVSGSGVAYVSETHCQLIFPFPSYRTFKPYTLFALPGKQSNLENNSFTLNFFLSSLALHCKEVKK